MLDSPLSRALPLCDKVGVIDRPSRLASAMFFHETILALTEKTY